MTSVSPQQKKRKARLLDTSLPFAAKKSSSFAQSSLLETTWLLALQNSRFHSLNHDNYKVIVLKTPLQIKTMPSFNLNDIKSAMLITLGKRTCAMTKSPCTFCILKKICQITCLLVSQLVTKLDNQLGAECLIDAKDKEDYQNCTIFYHARLLFMLCNLNGAKLKFFYSTLLLIFYARLDKNKKKKLKKLFDNVYNKIES